MICTKQSFKRKIQLSYKRCLLGFINLKLIMKSETQLNSQKELRLESKMMKEEGIDTILNCLKIF